MALFDIPTSVCLNCENKCSRISDNTKQPLHHFSHRFQSSQTSGEEALTGLSSLVNLRRETVVETAISPYCVRFILPQVSRHTRPLFMRCVSEPVKKNDSFFLFSATRLPLSDESESGEIWASNKPSCSPKTNKASVLCLVMKAHSHVKGVFLLVATDALIQH